MFKVLWFEIGRYWKFMYGLLIKPEKFIVYYRQVMRELVSIGVGAMGIVAITSIFMGAIITIQSAYNLVNPLVPLYAVGIVTRDSIILEFSPTIILLVL